MLWQESFIAQPEQPQEQEPLPFFLSIIPFTIIAITAIPISDEIIIVGHINETPLFFKFFRAYSFLKA